MITNFNAWFIKPCMCEVVICGWRYEIRNHNLEARSNLYDAVR